MGTLLAVAAARYRRVMTPDKPPLPPFPTVLATWVLGVCIVLPYALYMHYIDFEVFLGPQFAGVGICTVNLEDDVTEYIHCLFIILFVLPLGVVAFLQVRVGVALAALGDAAPPPNPPRPRDLPPPDPHPRVWNLHPSDHVFSSIRNEGRNRSICTEHHQMSTFLPLGAEVGGCGGGGEERGQLGTSTPSSPQLVQNGGGGAAVEAARERTDQRYLVALVIFFAVCVCPLMVLRLVKNMIDETEQNAAHFDLAFVTAVWVAFLPTITTPALYTAWRMGSPFKNRLLSHLRPCPWERRQRYPPTPTHEMPPMFNSAHPAHANHAHAAHRLSLQHSLLPPSPRPHHAHAHPSSSHALRKDLVLHRQQQFPVERVSFSS